MLAIEFTFPAGRYHATPWGRHVNEGEVAWPPEPWRLLRALLAAWHRKVAPLGGHREQDLEALLHRLAERLPRYVLPPAQRGHSRHYMPQGTKPKGKSEATSLVLDAFARLAPGAGLQVLWPEVRLEPAQQRLLDALLEATSYLGRAESWVEARRIEHPAEPNCVPLDEEEGGPQGEARFEVVELLAPISPARYAELRERLLAEAQARFKKKDRPTLLRTLPERFVEALQVESADLQALSWNLPPAARWIRYARPLEALAPRHALRPAPAPAPARAALFVLDGKPLPPLQEALRVGELARWALMRAADPSGEGRVPPLLSGHDLPEGPPHRHAFFLPLDTDGDGFVDHLLVDVPGGLDERARAALGRLRRLYDHEGGRWELQLVGFDPPAERLRCLGPARRWRSVTPYLHPWHRKRRFGPVDQIRRECALRGLPEPVEIHQERSVRVGGRTRRPVHFRRERHKRSLVQPDRHGSFWRLRFEEPVRGPLALGFGCHFGLGLFVPEEP